MENQYKLTISNAQFYKEIELPLDEKKMCIGTTKVCGIRLNPERFFGDFELHLEQTGSRWSISCGEQIYLTTDGLMKIYTKDLEHGDELYIRRTESNQELLKINFTYDFDAAKTDFERKILLSGVQSLVIGGGEQCQIKICDLLVGNDTVTLTREGSVLRLTDHGTKYGIYVNGCRARGSALLRSYDFFSIAGVTFYYKEDALYTTAGSKVELNGLKEELLKESDSCLRYPKFNRNTRVQYVQPEIEIEIQAPPPKPQGGKKNIIFSLIPSLSMLALMVVLRGIMGGGGTFVIYSVCSMSIGIIMSIVTFLHDGRQLKKERAEREKQYLKYIKEKELEIETAQENEKRIANLIHSSLEESLGEVERFGRRLFEKTKEDCDFLDVRLGTGTVDSCCAITFQKQEFVDIDDPISLQPEHLAEKHRRIDGAPIVARLAVACGVGVVGQRERLYEVLENVTLDIAVRQFYQDVRLFYLLPENAQSQFMWLRWLPHAQTKELGLRNFIYHEESRKILLELLYSELSRRESEKRERDTADFGPHFVIFVYDSSGLRKHPISKYIENSRDYGFTFLFFEEHEELLPQGCTEIVRLANDGTNGAHLLSENGDLIAQFTYPTISDETAERVALRLAPICVDEVSLDSALTKSITLFDLLHIFGVSDLDLSERWEKAEVYKSMAAPLGVKLKNELVYLDISDRGGAHGPHGLVAGTTGSGKSEILQTYVLSMATLFHPHDVGFVIIDFKGGGMANQFKDLPHLMGAITNIDGREIERSLSAIKAELVKRQTLFAQSGVNHINDYIKLYKRHEVELPLPHLIMIADEFAELKAEYPDFMKEIISAARIGRTLGVHLILATQKPSGVVDNQIWSNSKFKLCLKVQTKEDSNEVIKSPLAAEIVEPGRAYFQVGNNEIFELFQSAYSGAEVPKENGESNAIHEIYTLELWGKRSLMYTNHVKCASDGTLTQLQALVTYIDSYCRENQITPLAGICLPPLADKVFAAELAPLAAESNQELSTPVGLYDDPEQQRQESVALNLAEGNVYIIGSSQTGKTTFLQTILCQTIATTTPEQVNFYAIDCGSRALKIFEQSNHVGGVVLPAEEERVINLFKMLKNMIALRKERLGAAGLGTYRSYREAGFHDLPQVVLIIDNIAAFREHYPDADDDLLILSREGQSMGISLIVTASQTNALNYKALSNFGIRFAFHCNDSGEYSRLFDRCRIEPKEIPGRGLCVIDRRLVEFQAALCIEGEREIERVENLRAVLNACNESYPKQKAAPIPEVPENLDEDTLFAEQAECFRVPYVLPLGMDYERVDFVSMELHQAGALVLTGSDSAGKLGFLRYLFSALNRTILTSNTQAWIFDDNSRALRATEGYGYVEAYTTDPDQAAVYLEELLERLKERRTCLRENGEVREEPLLLAVLESKVLLQSIAADKSLSQTVRELMRMAQECKCLLLFSGIENTAPSFSAPEFLKTLREQRQGILFGNLADCRFYEVQPRQVKELDRSASSGTGFFFRGNQLLRIKMIHDS